MKERLEIRGIDLCAGMILSKDFVINNVKLLNKKALVSSKLAYKINHKFPHEHLEIYSLEADENSTLYKESPLYKKERIKKYFYHMTMAAEEVFTKLETTNEIDIGLLRSLSNDILNSDHDKGLVIKDIIEMREINEYTLRHSVNTAVLSVLLGRWLHLSSKDLRLLSYGGILHDLGKSMIRPEVLNKEGTLTKKEYEEMKNHSRFGYEIVKRIPFIDKTVSLAVLMHHEREDGEGYPLGLKSHQITPFAKIIAIADTFDAMTSNRIYRDRICPLEVLDELKTSSFRKLDPSYTSIFIKNMLNFYIGDSVVLNNGEIGTIVKIDINNILRPLISIKDSFYNLATEKDLSIIDLI